MSRIFNPHHPWDKWSSREIEERFSKDLSFENAKLLWQDGKDGVDPSVEGNAEVKGSVTTRCREEA